MGAGFSGKDGTVKIGSTDIFEIRNWKFNPKSNNPKYASNKTSGYKRTVAGVKEGSGSMSGAWDHANDFLAVVDVGASATLKLYTDTTHFFSVPSVIDDVSVNVDVDNGEIVSWDSNFSANGAWANPAAPMMAPAGFGAARGAGAESRPVDMQNPGGFTAEQMALISQVAASAALAALQSFKTNPNAAQSSESGGSAGDVVMSEPGGVEPHGATHPTEKPTEKKTAEATTRKVDLKDAKKPHAG